VKVRVVPRPLLAGLAFTAVLTACGASAPPADELANEIIDTLEHDGVPLSDEVKACMHRKVDDFALTPEEAQGFENLDDVANKAADGNEQAKLIMDRFEAELASCNT
jgi:hypothetical protein